MVSILVACGRHNVIGKDNKLPWKDLSCLKMFKEMTIGHTIIYGRKTWESLPVTYLNGRTNIVLSSKAEKYNTEFANFRQVGNGLFFVKSFKEALELANTTSTEEVFVTGGQMTFECALSLEIVDKVHMVKIYEPCDGDKFFPIMNGGWLIDEIRGHEGFDMVEYTREDYFLRQKYTQQEKILV